MTSYRELKEKQQQEVNDFPLMFAFGNQQFAEMLEKNNVTIKDIYSIGAGGYVKKTDAPAMNEMFARHKKELAEARKQIKFLKEAFYHEMANHEYCITYDDEEIFSACGVTAEDYRNNEDIRKAWKAAKAAYLQEARL